MKLTDKVKAFCQEYVVDFNGTRAAIAAGYSKKTAAVIATENLRKPNVQEYLNELKEERAERVEISQDYVLKVIKNTIERCSQAEPVMIRDGRNWVESGEYKFDSTAVLKGAELLGRHLAMFTDRNIVDVKGSVDPDKWLEANINKNDPGSGTL